MPHSDFVHLRVHSAYSLSEGAIKIKELVKLCQDNAMPAVAVTDSGNLFGALEFASTASQAGIQPIIGCQLAIGRADEEAAAARNLSADRVVLLAQNEAGYRNLLKLVSDAYLHSEDTQDPQVDRARLFAHSAGLLLLTGGPGGPLDRALLAGQDALAETTLLAFKQAFPGRLYIELQRHDLEDEDAVEGRLVDLAYAHDVPLVATNDAYFADEALYEAHDALLCIAGGTYVSEGNRRRLTPHHRFKTAAEMRALFVDLPEAVENSLTIARRCSWFPKAVDPILPAFPTAAGRDEGEELRAEARAGLEQRLETHVYEAGDSAEVRAEKAAVYWDRLDFELGIITQMGFSGYFLIVADFIKWAKGQGIPVGPGRGSGAGSVVAWSLTITGLDPIRWGLLFERFLNPERVSMPDFDIDFCQERRDEVIRYVQQKYGRDRVAQIITFGKLQARAVLRDVGRVLQMPYGQIDQICKMVPNNPANPLTLQQAIDGEPRLREMQREDKQVARLIDIALKLEGLFRHASTHAAGLVISDRPLDEMVPLYRDPRSDMPVTQFNMKWVEQAGLVKFDFLGLKTLTVLARARELIREREPDFDYEDKPLTDARSYEIMAKGDTVGIFQLESSGMRDALRKLKPDRFEDVIAMVSLYRPGPMENIPSYIARKKGEQTPDYLYETLQPILEETFGIIIYQEQVMQIAQVLACYSLGKADLLRRAMGKKIKAEMDAQRLSFVEGAKDNRVREDVASGIFDLVAKFAGYGFNKSHAAAYALVAYHTAYLKANYPVEFLAASMTFDMGNTDKLNVFRQELGRLEIDLLPPDINLSRADFAVEADEQGKGGIRYALGAIKNVGAAAMRQLCEERDARGFFTGLRDLAQRLDARSINKRAIENLARAGAFDRFNRNRQQVYLAAETIVRHAANSASERDAGQTSLFGGTMDAPADDIKLPPVPDWPAMERLQNEFEAIGFYLSAHPLDASEAQLRRKRVVSYADLPRVAALENGRKTLAGIVVSKQERTSRKGNRFAFVQLSDCSGVFEVMVFSDVLQASRDLLESGRPLLVEVTVDRQGEGGDMKLLAQRFEDLEQSLETAAAGLKICLESPEPLQHLKTHLDREGRGRGTVLLVLRLDGGQEVEIDLPGGYAISRAGRQAIKAIPKLEVTDL